MDLRIGDRREVLANIPDNSIPLILTNLFCDDEGPTPMLLQAMERRSGSCIGAISIRRWSRRWSDARRAPSVSAHAAWGLNRMQFVPVGRQPSGRGVQPGILMVRLRDHADDPDTQKKARLSGSDRRRQ
jgi:hypothetical protein